MLFLCAKIYKTKSEEVTPSSLSWCERGDRVFKINGDQSIYLTRGDIASIEVSAQKSADEAYVFQVGDVVRMQVFERGNCHSVVLQKSVEVLEESKTVDIYLNKEDTKLGDLINKPKDYWYEIELNPDTAPQTIVGYDEEGAKVFRLFPEGSE